MSLGMMLAIGLGVNFSGCFGVGGVVPPTGNFILAETGDTLQCQNNDLLVTET